MYGEFKIKQHWDCCLFRDNYFSQWYGRSNEPVTYNVSFGIPNAVEWKLKSPVALVGVTFVTSRVPAHGRAPYNPRCALLIVTVAVFPILYLCFFKGFATAIQNSIESDDESGILE